MSDRQQEAVAAAEAALVVWDEVHKVQPTDPGMQSMRFHESQATRDKSLDSYLSRLGREKRERARLEKDLDRAKRAAFLANQPTTPVDPADLEGATAVQVLTHGAAVWHRLIRVNKTTVTCWAAPGMDQPRYPHNRVVGVRHTPNGETNE